MKGYEYMQCVLDYFNTQPADGLFLAEINYISAFRDLELKWGMDLDYNVTYFFAALNN